MSSFVSPTTVELLKVFDCTIGVMGEATQNHDHGRSGADEHAFQSQQAGQRRMNMRRLGDPG